MGIRKDRNGMDLTEAEDTEKRWQKYTEELYKKYLHDPDNHNDVITHLKPLILECKVKWTLGSITTNKASGGDEIPVELFQILKDNAISAKSAKSAALNTPANLENSAVATGLEKVSFHSNSKERHCQKMFRLLHNCPLLTHYQSNAELSQAKKKSCIYACRVIRSCPTLCNPVDCGMSGFSIRE